jgi:hypothetical protein
MKPPWKAKQRKQRRTAFIVTGTILSLLGVGTLLHGSIFYRDWRGLNAFAPLEILLGLAIVGFGLFGFRDSATRN